MNRFSERLRRCNAVVIGLCLLTLGGCEAQLELPYETHFEKKPGHVLIDNTAAASKWDLESEGLAQQQDLGFVPQSLAFEDHTHAGSNFVLKGSAHLSQYSLLADIELRSPLGDVCGVLFRYHDENNYYRLSSSFRDAFTMLERKRHGRWSTLAVNALGVSPFKSHQFEIKNTSSHVAVFLNGKQIFIHKDESNPNGAVGLFSRNDCLFRSLALDSIDSQIVVDVQDDYLSVARGIISIGDSNTNGRGDLYSRDGLSNSGLRHGAQGFQSNLMNLLDTLGETSIVHNAGIVGEQTAWLKERIAGYIQRYQGAQEVLLMIGTNDVLSQLESGIGCVGEACADTYAANIQSIGDQLQQASKKTYLALLPPLWGDHARGRYLNPMNHESNRLIREFNMVAQTQTNGFEAGPDLYRYFLGDKNRSFLFADLYHPNGLGAAVVAGLWFQALTKTAHPLPYIVDDIRVRIENPVSTGAQDYQLNLLEVGDHLYVDRDWAITEMPVMLAEARWLVTADRDKNVTFSDYLTFDVGPKPVDLFLIFPMESNQPKWMETWEATPLVLRTEKLRYVVLKKSNSVGIQELAGPGSAGGSLPANYVLAITPPSVSLISD